VFRATIVTGPDLECANLSEKSNGLRVYPRISIIEMGGVVVCAHALLSVKVITIVLVCACEVTGNCTTRLIGILQLYAPPTVGQRTNSERSRSQD
jgi:hypothetical protein